MSHPVIETPAACEHIVTTYVVPNILHFVAFFIGIYHFRIQENEQLYALMEKVGGRNSSVTASSRKKTELIFFSELIA